MVNCETGREIPSKGRKFQIYGWHLVQKIDDEKMFSREIDATKFQNEVKFECESESTSVNNVNGNCSNKSEDLKKNLNLSEDGKSEVETKQEDVAPIEKNDVVAVKQESNESDTQTNGGVTEERTSDKKRKRLI